MSCSLYLYIFVSLQGFAPLPLRRGRTTLHSSLLATGARTGDVSAALEASRMPGGGTAEMTARRAWNDLHRAEPDSELVPAASLQPAAALSARSSAPGRLPARSRRARRCCRWSLASGAAWRTACRATTRCGA